MLQQNCQLSSHQLPALGIYVHIPFCAHICPYCDFVKTNVFPRKNISVYFEEITRQLEDFLSRPDILLLSRSKVTIYFGGGTPGLFPGRFYAPLIKLVKKQFTVVECTIETNPLMNSERLLEGWIDVGINRLTLGAQSLCPRILGILGRKHTPDLVLENLGTARRCGMKQVQVDLIYGLRPGTRSHSLDDEVTKLVDAGATGFSAYALTIEPQTAFGNQPQLAHEDQAWNDYCTIYNNMMKYGFFQWETSNYSWYEPLHNSLYWNNIPYIGVGTGAHGLLPSGERYCIGKTHQQVPGIHDFSKLQDPIDSKELFNIHFEPKPSTTNKVTELVYTTLRTWQGLSFAKIRSLLPHFNENNLTENPFMKRLIEEKGAEVHKNHLRLNHVEKFRGDMWALTILKILEPI